MDKSDDKIRSQLIDSMNELIRRLRADRDKIDAELHQAERNLSHLSMASKAPSNSSTARRPRGQNREAIRQMFVGNPGLAARLTDISQDLHITRSSVQSAMKKLPEIELGEDGLYRMKTQTSSDLLIEDTG